MTALLVLWKGATPWTTGAELGLGAVLGVADCYEVAVAVDDLSFLTSHTFRLVERSQEVLTQQDFCYDTLWSYRIVDVLHGDYRPSLVGYKWYNHQPTHTLRNLQYID